MDTAALRMRWRPLDDMYSYIHTASLDESALISPTFRNKTVYFVKILHKSMLTSFGDSSSIASPITPRSLQMFMLRKDNRHHVFHTHKNSMLIW